MEKLGMPPPMLGLVPLGDSPATLAEPSTASAFPSDTYSVSASAVRFWKSALSSATFASSPESSRWH